MKKAFSIILCLALLALLTLPALADDTVYTHGTLYYTVSDGSVTVVGAFGSSPELTVPPSIGGTPVNTIAPGAFANCTSLETLNLPDTITAIGENAVPNGVQVVYNSNTDPSLVPPALLTQSQEQTPEPAPDPQPPIPPAPAAPATGDAVSEAETDLTALEQSEAPAVTAAPLETDASAPDAQSAPADSEAPARLTTAVAAPAESPVPPAVAQHAVWYLLAAAAVLTASLVFVVLRLHRH